MNTSGNLEARAGQDHRKVAAYYSHETEEAAIGLKRRCPLNRPVRAAFWPRIGLGVRSSIVVQSYEEAAKEREQKACEYFKLI